jgi:RNA polymerase sigma factor (sigma-70 family)
MLTAALYPEYRQQAWRYARWLTGCDDDADEIVHDAFCKLMGYEKENGKCPDPSGALAANPVALLFTIVRNQSIDVLRKRRREQVLPVESVAEMSAREMPVSGNLEMRDLEDALREGVAGLPKAWSDALCLRVAGELGYDEIAGVLGCSRNQVRTWIHRARKQLGASLALRGFECPAERTGK